MEAVTSFTARRPAAGSLPAFTLPPPTSDVPRAVDGISPSQSSVNTGSSQGSQASGNMQYTYNNGHVHGSWPTPGGTSSYSVAGGTQHPQPISHNQYGSRPSLYPQSSGLSYSQPRTAASPAAGSEGLPAPPYDQVQPPFQTSLSSGSGGSGHGGQHSSLGQSSASGGSLGALDAFSQSRSQSNPSYYGSSSYNQHSPTAGPSGPRSLSSMPAPGSSMAPPAYHRPSYPFQPALPSLPGSMVPGMHQPGHHMGMLPAIGLPSYTPSPMVYGAPTPTHTERPFKCDQCTQSFSRNHDLKRHKRIHLSVKPFPCNYCSKSFSRKDALKRHRLVKGCENKAKENGSSEDQGDRSVDGDDDYDQGRRPS